MDRTFFATKFPPGVLENWGPLLTQQVKKKHVGMYWSCVSTSSRTGILEKNKPRCWVVATLAVEVASSYRTGETGNYLSCKYI